MDYRKLERDIQFVIDNAKGEIRGPNISCYLCGKQMKQSMLNRHVLRAHVRDDDIDHRLSLMLQESTIREDSKSHKHPNFECLICGKTLQNIYIKDMKIHLALQHVMT